MILPNEGNANTLDHKALFTCDKPAFSGARVYRLTQAQWRNTFFNGDAVIGTRTPLAGGPPADRYSGYASRGGLDQPTLDALMPIAADWARNQAKISKIPCIADPAAQLTADCVRTFVRGELRAAFRRPPGNDEVELFAGRIERRAAQVGKAAALEATLASLMLSPHALFRWEVGDGAPDASGRRALSSWETASALSYTVVNRPPDAALAAAAEQNALATVDQLRAHARRLAGAADRNEKLKAFMREYWRYDRAEDVFKDPAHRLEVKKTLVAKGIPDATANRMTDMQGQGDVVGSTNSWIQSMLPQKPLVAKLLTGRVNTVPNEPRAGMLTERSFLMALSEAATNDPIRRGKFITETLTCTALERVDPATLPEPVEDPTKTLRERLTPLTHAAGCVTCHQYLDAVGYGLESFDDFGFVRALEAGRPIDARGHLRGTGDSDGAFDGPVELANRLASSTRVRQCFVRQSFRYYMGRNETLGDACALTAIDGAYQQSGGDIVETLAALVASDSFRYRK